MLTNNSTTKVSISGLSYNNLLEDLYNAIQDDSTLKETFTDFTSNSAERLIAEMYAYVAQQLANRIDQVGNELFVDTASKEGLTRLLKLVGYKVELPACASLSASATVGLNTTEIMQLSRGIRQDATATVTENENLLPTGNDFLVVSSNTGTNYELIKREEDTQKFDYLTAINFQAPATDFSLHQGVTNYRILTINTTNRIKITLDKSPVIKDSVRIYYRKSVKQANGSFAFAEMNKVENFFTTSALTNNTTGNFVERNLGNGRCEITIQPWKDANDETLNDLDKEIVIMYRVGGGAAGNINIGNLNTSTNKYFNNGNVQAAIKFYNTTAGVGGKDEITDAEIKDTVVNEVRNSKLAVTDEDYEYLFPKNDTDIGFIKAYGEKDIASESLANTYGYYVNPINVWLLVLKHNETLKKAYTDELENLTDYINDICFQTLDLNNRFNEKYQINGASLNHYVSAAELASLKEDNYYNISLNSDELKVLKNGGSKIAVTYTPYSPTKDLQGINTFNSDEFIFEPKEKCEGEQYVIQEEDGSLTTFTPVIYNEEEALRATPSLPISGKFQLNNNNIELTAADSIPSIVDAINAQYSGASYIVKLKENISNTTDAVNSAFFTNSTGYTLTIDNETYVIEITNPSFMNYTQLYMSMKEAMNKIKFPTSIEPFLYNDVANGCYVLAIISNKSFGFAEREKDYADSTNRCGFYNYYLANNQTASSVYSTTAVITKSQEGWPGEVLSPICAVATDDENSLVFYFDNGADTLTITTDDLSIKRAFDIDNTFVATKQKKISCSYITNDNPSAILTISLSSVKENLKDGIYINLFGKSNSTITLGDYYYNIEKYEPELDGTLKALLARKPLRKLYSTKYMIGTNGASTIDQYGSDYQVKFSTKKIGGKTFYQINNNDAPAIISSLCANESLVKDYGDKKLYIRVNNEKYDEEEKTICVYDAKKGAEAYFTVASEEHYAYFKIEDFTGKRTVLLFDAILELFYDKLENNSDYENGYLGFMTKTSDYLSCIDFGNTDSEILYDLFNITNSMVTSSEGQITPSQMKATYFNLSTYDGTFAVNEELIFKVNNYDEVVVKTGANLSEFRANIENTIVGGIYSLSKFITVENNKIVFISFNDGDTITLKAKFKTNAQKNKILKMFDMGTFSEYTGTVETVEYKDSVAIDSDNFVDQILTITPKNDSSNPVELEINEGETIDEFAKDIKEIETLDVKHKLKNVNAEGKEYTLVVPFDEYRSYKPFVNINKMFNVDNGWEKYYNTIHHNTPHTGDTETSKKPLESMWAVGMSLYTKGQKLNGVLDYDDSKENLENRKNNGWTCACYYNDNKKVLFVSQNGCIMIGEVKNDRITIVKQTGVNSSLINRGAVRGVAFSEFSEELGWCFTAITYGNGSYISPYAIPIYIDADNNATFGTEVQQTLIEKASGIYDAQTGGSDIIYLSELGYTSTALGRCPTGKVEFSEEAKNYRWVAMDVYPEDASATSELKIHVISEEGQYYYSEAKSEGETVTYVYTQGGSLSSIQDPDRPNITQTWISITHDNKKNIFAISREGVVAKYNRSEKKWELVTVINTLSTSSPVTTQKFDYNDIQTVICNSSDDRILTFITFDGYAIYLNNPYTNNVVEYIISSAEQQTVDKYGTIDLPTQKTKYVRSTAVEYTFADTLQIYTAERLKDTDSKSIKSAYNVIQNSDNTSAKIKFYPTTEEFGKTVTAEENLYNDKDNENIICDFSKDDYKFVETMSDFASYFNNEAFAASRHITTKVLTIDSSESGMYEWGFMLDYFDKDFYLGFMFSDENTMNKWHNLTGKVDHGMYKMDGSVFKKYEVGEYRKNIAKGGNEELIGFANDLDIYYTKEDASSKNPTDFEKTSTLRDWSSFGKALQEKDIFSLTHLIYNVSGDGTAEFNKYSGYIPMSNLNNYSSELSGKTINIEYQKSMTQERACSFTPGDTFVSFQNNLQAALNDIGDNIKFTYSGTIYTVASKSITVMGVTALVSSKLSFTFSDANDITKLFPNATPDTGTTNVVTIENGGTLKYVGATLNGTVDCAANVSVPLVGNYSDSMSFKDAVDLISFAKKFDELVISPVFYGRTVTIVPSQYGVWGAQDNANIDIITDLVKFIMKSNNQTQTTFDALLNLIDGKYLDGEVEKNLISHNLEAESCNFKLKLNYKDEDDLEAIKAMFPTFDQDFKITFGEDGYLLASRTNRGVYYISYDKDAQTYYLNVLDKNAFPYGDIYFHMVEDFTSDHIVSTDVNNINTYTDEYIWNNMFSDKKMMFVEHLFKQPRFVTFDLSITVKISTLSGLNKQDEYKEKVYKYLKEAYDIYNGPISADLSTTYLRSQICAIDSQIVDTTVNYLGTDMTDESTNIANTSNNLVTDFNQKLVLSSQKTNGEAILHGLQITVEYDV